MKTEEQPTQSVVQFFITSSGIVVSSNVRPDQLHKDLPLHERFDQQQSQIALIHILKKVAQEARALYGVVDSVNVLISSPWCISETHTVNYLRNNEFIVTKELLTGNVRSEVTRIEYKQEKKESALRVIEAESVQVRLNGYVTEKPIGQKVRRIETDLLISYMRQDLYAEITHILTSNFHITNIQYHSLVHGYRNFFNQANTPVLSGTIIDYMAEYIEVSLMNERGIYFTQSLPLGFYQMVRTIADVFKVDIQTARSLVRMYYEGIMQESDAKKMKRLLTTYKDECMGALFRTLADGRSLQTEYNLPLPVYVIADDFWKNNITFNTNDMLCMQDLLIGPAQTKAVSVVEINRNYIYNYLY